VAESGRRGDRSPLRLRAITNQVEHQIKARLTKRTRYSNILLYAHEVLILSKESGILGLSLYHITPCAMIFKALLAEGIFFRYNLF
jgi:hypothetical protein